MRPSPCPSVRLAARPPGRPSACPAPGPRRNPPSQAPETPRAPHGSACARLGVSACPPGRVSVCPRVRSAVTPAPACSPVLPARSCACAPVCLAAPSRVPAPSVDPPCDCPLCPLLLAPSVYLSASPIVRLPCLSASPRTVRLPVRLFFEGGLFLCGCFCFFVGFLCEGGRVNVSRSGCTEDATQRARTCGGSCMSLEKPRWWSPFGGCQRTMLRQQCLFESIVMLRVRCTPARPPARPPVRPPVC